MKKLPIIFGARSIQAIQAREKTVTRRVMNPQWRPDIVPKEHSQFPGYWIPYTSDGRLANGEPGSRKDDCGIRCPYGIAGQTKLWVKETWQPGYEHRSTHDGEDASVCEVVYRTDNAISLCAAPDDVAEKWARIYADDGPDDPRWRSPIFMPKWAARIWLLLKDVRVERLWDITPDDCYLEGLKLPVAPAKDEDGNAIEGKVIPLIRLTGKHPPFRYLPKVDPPACYTDEQIIRAEYFSVWDELNKKRGYGYETNPWLFRLEFEPLEA